MSKNHSDILILGAGPSGLSAAISCKINNPGAKVRIIEKSPPFNKIGCVIRDDTLGYIEELEVDSKEIGQIYQFDTNNIMSIERSQLEAALIRKAKSLGVDFVLDTICRVEGGNNVVSRVVTKSNGTFTAFYFIDATGQVALIPKLFGLRKPSGSAFKALYTHFLSNDLIEIVKNRVVDSGFVWIIPLPHNGQGARFKYQLLKVLKEGTETLTHTNLFKAIPFLKEIGASETIRFMDPCNVFDEYVRQYPPFIYDNEASKGMNWMALGDSDSTYFDRIFSGIDKAILDGIKAGEVLSEI